MCSHYIFINGVPLNVTVKKDHSAYGGTVWRYITVNAYTDFDYQQTVKYHITQRLSGDIHTDEQCLHVTADVYNGADVQIAKIGYYGFYVPVPWRVSYTSGYNGDWGAIPSIVGISAKILSNITNQSPQLYNYYILNR